MELAFASTLPTVGTTLNSPGFGLLTINARWGYFDQQGSIVSDSAFGISAPHCFRHRYPAGLPSGGGGIAWSLSPTVSGTVVSYQRWYQSEFFQMEGTQWEGPGSSGQNKVLGFWGVAGLQNAIYSVITSGSGTLTAGGNRRSSTWSLNFRQQGIGYPSSPGILGSGVTLSVGTRYRIEIEMTMNTDGGPNGILRVWVTNLSSGTIVSREESGVVWRFSTNPNTGFFQRRLDPTFGGSGGDALTVQQFSRWDHCYYALRTRMS
jgi:hypothetical protein